MRKNLVLKLSMMVCAAGLLGGCASRDISSQSQYLGFLPKPHQVLVYDFAVSPDEVEHDSSVELVKDLAKKTPRTEQERALGRQVSDALIKHLIPEIQALGIPAVRASLNTLSGPDNLFVRGQLISVNEGKAAERVVVGLGLGRTDVRTMTQVYGYLKGKKMLVDEFDVNAKSSSKPSIAETVEVGAAAGSIVTSAIISTGAAVGSEAFSASVDADAARAAKAIAIQLKIFYFDQGWVQP